MVASAGAMGSQALTIIYWVFVACLVLALGFYVFFYFTFNCKIRILYLTQGKDQISDKKGKIIKDRKDGIQKLVIRMGLFRSETMPSPPPEATSLDLRGKRCFMVEFGDDGGKRYIVRKRDSKDYTPLSTNDRVFYANEEEKRIQRQKKGIHDLIAAAIPYIALCIILGMLLAFWGDVVKPLREENAAWRTYTNQITEKQAQIMSDLREIIKKEQVVPSEPKPVLIENIAYAAEDTSPKPPPDN